VEGEGGGGGEEEEEDGEHEVVPSFAETLEALMKVKSFFNRTARVTVIVKVF
jgi:hypothetical protein